VVFGIGNPGPRYQRTRHNLGFEVIDALCAGRGMRIDQRLGAAGAPLRIEGEPVLCVKPLTYVNRCGPVLEALRHAHGLELDRLLVVVDDLNLPPGRLRLRAGGSDGGHNGLRSLIDSLDSTGFPRLRIGIGGPAGLKAEEYVLQPVPEAERPSLASAVERAAAAVRLWIRAGTENAMSEVNRADLDRDADRA
jgi:PTH1 family peptidyl-tRNA hydrolase